MVLEEETISKLEQIRKIHPKAGLKWLEQEDKDLLVDYENFKKQKGDFEEFLNGLSKKFQRAPNGIRGRLAKTFLDIPGWNYEIDKQRQEAKEQADKLADDPKNDKVLIAQYEVYAASKKETFYAFTGRLAENLGVKRRIVKLRLKKIVNNLEIYTRDDLGFREVNNSKTPEIPDINFEENPQSAEAYRLMEETNKNIFLTGEAGTGKSTLLQYFRYTTKKNIVVLAPTGVAAVNVGGQTIHSFCGFGSDITLSRVKKASPFGGKKSLLDKLDVIIIDEISMVRADLLDCLDKFLRMSAKSADLPFGGIQMIFVGDLYQLPPVEKDFIYGQGLFKEYNSPYFFDSRSFREGKFIFLELKKVYRQKDQDFLAILSAIRNNAVLEEHLLALNQRSSESGAQFSFEKFSVYLTPTNSRAKQVNEYLLSRLNTEERFFEGVSEGRLQDKNPPGEEILRLKVGAQIMMLNNDQRKRWVNGTMGKIIGYAEVEEESEDSEEIDEYESDEFGPSDYGQKEKLAPRKSIAIVVELETGEKVYVNKHTWEMFQFILNKGTKQVETKTVGTFTQYPLKLAWALTIHKSQGKTFNKVCLDLASGTFAHGQLYVALSRCRTLEGLVLRQPIAQEHIILDNRVINFLENYKKQQDVI